MHAHIAHYQNKLAYEMDPSDLFEALNKEEKIIVVDARQAAAFDRERIPGAISFPHRTMNAESVKNLDKRVTYVVYCDGIGCNASTKGALNLAKLGFNVRELIGGIQWWKLDGYATEGTQAYVGGEKLKCYC